MEKKDKEGPVEERKKKRLRHTQLSDCGCVQSYKCLTCVTYSTA